MAKSGKVGLIQAGVITVTVMLLCACQQNPFTPIRGSNAGDAINSDLSNDIENNSSVLDYTKNRLPESVYEQLLPSLALKPPTFERQTFYNLDVDHYPAREFFKKLVKNTRYNVLLSDDVSGFITLHLHKVTIPEILHALQDNYGYIYTVENYGIKIEKNHLEIKTFHVNYIDMQRDGVSNTTVVGTGELTPIDDNGKERSRNSDKPASSIETKFQANFWKTLNDTLIYMVGNVDGKGVVVNPEAGIVIVRAYPKMLDEVSNYLDSLQSIMTRQVIIEAKILQIRLNKGFQAGVDWNLLGASQNTTKDFDGSNLNSFSQAFSLNVHSGSNFSMIMHLLSDQGNVQVLSSPRISTLNNQKALIKVGTDQYFVTNVKNTLINTATVNDQNIQDVSLTPFFSGIALDVTPEISSNDNITLQIHPVISDVKESAIKYKINGQDQEIPSALSEIKESDSVVRAKNGQIVVIGGLMENESSEYQAGTPFLSNIPFVGSLFRRTSQQGEKTELVILLKPVVTNNTTWIDAMKKAKKQFSDYNEGFHIGSQYNDFGNMGEFPGKSGNG